MSTEIDIDAAATALLDAYAKNDRSRYFALFTPDASFIFPTVDQVMTSRAAYEAQWQRWIDETDFVLQDCISTERDIRVYGDVAVLTHRTLTHSTSIAGALTLDERETIIFHKVDDRWLAVHEHVSPWRDPP